MNAPPSPLPIAPRDRDDVRLESVGRGRALIVALDGPHEVLSWAIVNGGRRRADCVIWREVRLAELGPQIDARALMTETLAALNVPAAVGLLTARDVRRYEDATAERAGVSARCIATVGLGNALAAGDPPAPAAPGTINLLCRVSVPLSEEALIEACALAAEARTAALLAANVRSTVSERLASGTGTDCIVVAAPLANARGLEFAGKHTGCGSAIGAAVYEAVSRGVRRWLEENACTST
jgi:adenosylcobinamide amidohydrolase